MFRQLRLVLVFSALLFLTGCTTQKVQLDMVAEKLCDEPVHAYDLYCATTPSDFERNHYVESPIVTDYQECVRNYTTQTGASTLFAQRFTESDHVDIYPVYGTFLEPTDMIVCVFSTDETATGIGSLTLNASGQAVSSYFKDITVLPPVFTALSLEDCYMVISECKEENPDFKITGLVYCTTGYPMVYPIGAGIDNNVLHFVYGKPTPYEPEFTTPEEGCQILAEQRNQLYQLLSEITIFPWKTASFSMDGYIRRLSSLPPIVSSDYDLSVAIPLLTDDLDEDVYILHLLYKDYQFIGEYIIRRTRGELDTYKVIWEHLVSDGEPAESEYLKVLTQAFAVDKAWTPQGVIFDDGFKPVGISGNQVLYYDSETNSLKSY